MVSKKGNPWRSPSTGKFIDAPPGVITTKEAAKVFKTLDGSDRTVIDNVIKKSEAKGIDAYVDGDNVVFGVINGPIKGSFTFKKGDGANTLQKFSPNKAAPKVSPKEKNKSDDLSGLESSKAYESNMTFLKDTGLSSSEKAMLALIASGEADDIEELYQNYLAFRKENKDLTKKINNLDKNLVKIARGFLAFIGVGTAPGGRYLRYITKYKK